MKKSICLTVTALLMCGLMFTGCTANNQGSEKQKTTQTAKTMEEQVASDQHVIWVEYNNLKECKAKYTQDIATMNSLLTTGDTEIVLMDVQSKDPIQVDDSKIEATYRKVDKNQYILKTYGSFEKSTTEAIKDLAQINEMAQAQGHSYKLSSTKKIPLDGGVRVYFEKVKPS